LAIKILNASRFSLGRLGDGPAPGFSAVTAPLDRALLAQLGDVVRRATTAFEEFDYARAQEMTETFFWSFCDDYVELVKTRAYGEGDSAGEDDLAGTDTASGVGAPGVASARATLALALSVQLRLFAPFLPFVTEEVWHWWQPGSVHRAPWPTLSELGEPASGDDAVTENPVAENNVLTVAAAVLGAIRRAKTTEKRSMRAKVARLVVSAPTSTLAAVEAARGDLVDAGGVEALELVEADAFSVLIELAPEA
jgi:valyl-tRNA synthetase